ncbi:DUF3944 domain-containing protein [Fibrobacter sp. UWB13]|uniref:DUF3944 domain-containing protein n=1 Tax=Fibrobacter sp. UWB13 TaxID=1896204 RepID=UPI000A099746|nr:DUF3944 domain-containing protein [Fibrobacter sp. UWB13]SMG32385.1 Uncharacterized protein YaaW, UPF0174 family [Fibrobacter sp. UWB13]
MDYIVDKDLEFLKNIDSKKLNYLGHILLYDRIGKNRSTAFDESFELLSLNENNRDIKNWQIFAREIQCFGGNSFVNTVRRNGVMYQEILDDVANKMELTESLKGKNAVEKETKIIEKLKKYVEKIIQVQEELSIEEFQYVLREYFDTSSAMERLLQEAAAEQKHWVYKIGNYIIDKFYPEFKLFNPNWSVIMQAIVEISLLRNSTQGLSIAILGASKAGKSTLLKYLKTGKFIQLDEGSMSLERETSFVSPILNMPINEGETVPGDKIYVDKQKALCQNKDLILFCFNPKEVLEVNEKKNDFLSRLGMLKDLNEAKKIVFIATHGDLYVEKQVRFDLYKMIHTAEMGDVSSKLNIDDFLCVNLKDEVSTKEMFDIIKEKLL